MNVEKIVISTAIICMLVALVSTTLFFNGFVWCKYFAFISVFIGSITVLLASFTGSIVGKSKSDTNNKR